MRLQAFLTSVGILVSISCCLGTTTKPSNQTKPSTKQQHESSTPTPKISFKETSTKPTEASKQTTKSPSAHKKTGTTKKPSKPEIITKSTTAHKKTGTTKKPSPKTTPKPEIPCKLRNESCSKCLEGPDCFYCDSEKTCNKKHGIIPKGCKGNKWYWKQCHVLGNILIIVIPTVGGVLLIMLGCCIYCCCCRRCGKNSVAREERRQQQRRVDRQERNTERKQNRKARHDAIRMKYGLLQNMDDDDDTMA